MISHLEGKILDKNDKFFVVDINGVGYKVFSHSGILVKIPEIGQTVKIWTHLCVREDAMDLYGFLNNEEVDFFETLISISGIGPRSGRKTAQRLILELKTKLAKTVVLEKGGRFKEMGDAFEALVSLGYKAGDVRNILNELPKEMESVEDKVKAALKKLGRG
ncbi:MAG: Holliday junction DNA helicase RuvA, holliday junction DNA helicase RuvA [Parcubacteria group bacterium GW2011_GWC1_43_61]|nr:MAG: Holliday junction DNA helicase RuvA, holliday junction DNA helicase RuvA [Parcubacteria group bacterium GW2011_GWC1_43_61]